MSSGQTFVIQRVLAIADDKHEESNHSKYHNYNNYEKNLNNLTNVTRKVINGVTLTNRQPITFLRAGFVAKKVLDEMYEKYEEFSVLLILATLKNIFQEF